MNLKFKETEDQIKLIKAMGSKDPSISRPAQEAFAAFLGTVVNQVLQYSTFSSMIYKDLPYNEDEDPSFPLDLWYQKGINSVQVWSQNTAGGLGSTHITGMQEMRFQTFRIDSAIDMDKKYARKSRLDVVTAALNRLTEEVSIKLETNAFIIIMKALAEGSTNGLSHVINSTTANILQLNDFNKLLTLFKRINTSFDKRTAARVDGRLSDLIISPEMTEQIRAMAYQPMNTRTVDGTTGTPAGSSTAMPLPDAIRENIFNSAGTQEIYNVTLHELNEFGSGYPYNVLFKNFYSGSFTEATDEICVGLNLAGRAGFLRPIAKNADSGSTINILPDNQWFEDRVDKMGWYLSLEQSNICIDARKVLGLVV